MYHLKVVLNMHFHHLSPEIPLQLGIKVDLIQRPKGRAQKVFAV